MSWKLPFSLMGGSHEQQMQQDSLQSPYPPSVANSPSNRSRVSTPGSPSSVNFSERISRPKSPSLGLSSPAESAGIISQLRDKSVDELRTILTNRDAYANFFLSLDEVKAQNSLREELWKETLQLARQNLDKQPCILELRNQCQVIRVTELATAQERLHELVRQQEETARFYSLPSLLQKLQDVAKKVDEESDVLQRQLMETEIDLATFVQKYKKLRTLYHRRALGHLAARTSVI